MSKKIPTDSQWSSLASKVKAKQDKLVSGENLKTLNGNSLLGDGNLDIVADTSLPLYHTTWDSSGANYILTPADTVPNPQSFTQGTQFMFLANETHYSWHGINVAVDWPMVRHQYALVYCDGDGYHRVTNIQADTVYSCTFLMSVPFEGEMTTGIALIEFAPTPTDTGSSSNTLWVPALASTYKPTALTTIFGLNGGDGETVGADDFPENSHVRIYIDFTWSGSTSATLSMYPQSGWGADHSKYTGAGTEVYTNGTTRSAAKRTSWPLAGQISGITNRDSVHIEIEYMPAYAYDSFDGEMGGGMCCRTKIVKTGTFYESTWFSDPVSTWGSILDGLALTFSTAPKLYDFTLRSEYTVLADNNNTH